MDKLTVLNRALAFIGEEPITNPDSPETPAGKHINDGFDQARREVTRRYPWNWAETWTSINKTTAPPFGYTDAYALPEDFLRLLFVGDPTCDTIDFRLLRQGKPDYRRVIALNNGGAPTLKIGYSADEPLLSLWDPLAIKVLSIWLALDAAKAITGQKEHVALLNQMLSEELKDAVGVDGQEQSVLKHVDSFVQRERNMADYGATGFTNVIGYF